MVSWEVPLAAAVPIGVAALAAALEEGSAVGPLAVVVDSVGVGVARVGDDTVLSPHRTDRLCLSFGELWVF